MTKPIVAKRSPAILDLQPGTYYWCRCGKSENQPFCDGAHQGTDLTPLAFEIKEARKAALCQCKQTQNPPFCDGAHKHLQD